jgi:hypothetical protein
VCGAGILRQFQQAGNDCNTPTRPVSSDKRASALHLADTRARALQKAGVNRNTHKTTKFFVDIYEALRIIAAHAYRT